MVSGNVPVENLTWLRAAYTSVPLFSKISRHGMAFLGWTVLEEIAIKGNVKKQMTLINL